MSYYDGKNVTPLTGPDVVNDKTRLGVDAQLYYALPTLGGGSFKGEFYRGKEINPDSVRTMVTTATGGAAPRLLAASSDPSHFATDFRGWYAMWVQNLGEKLQLAARYEEFDPNTDLGLDQFRRAIEVRKALRKVDRAVLVGKARHHGEDADTDIRQLRAE